MNQMKLEGLALLAAIFLASACTVSKQYSRPKAPVPATWPAAAEVQEAGRPPGAREPQELSWEDFFTSEKLRRVIRVALENNRDLRMAALNVDKVQAWYRIQSAQLYPAVNASATADVYRLPEKMSKNGEAETVGQLVVGLGAASWELDLFGRIRSLKSQALEQYLASIEARSATQIALVAAVAGSYFALAADRESLRLSHATLDAQQVSYSLILRSREMGIASDLDLRQAETQVEAARAEIARYNGRVALDENALNLLAGAAIPSELLPDQLDSEHALREITAGMSSDVLLRRPDILMAEHQLKAAYANIGAARAAFFPRIALTAGAGLMSGDLAELFKAGSRTWNFAPQVVAPIFDAGARKANLQAAQLERDLAIAQYEKTIQTAFREVSDALSLRARLSEQQQAQEALVKSLEQTYRLARARYEAGIDSYLGVLVAQRSLYAGQQGLLSLRFARLNNLVTLYKVLGGGA